MTARREPFESGSRTDSSDKVKAPHERHPLPDSGEARHDEIPEPLEREKGRGDDAAGTIQPALPAVNPDGEPYEGTRK
jgi:hypothetical protein